MADRPILFSAPMVKALLDGRKTQTRRILKPGPLGQFQGVERDGSWLFTKGCAYGKIKPTHAIGDRLWVRESYYQRGQWDDVVGALTKGGKQKRCFVPADDDILFVPADDVSLSDWAGVEWHKRLGRFIPRRYSRLTLIVTDVRVERLQDCSEADAIAEGLQRVASNQPPEMGSQWSFGGDQSYWEPCSAYAALWDSINGPGAWEANPWVVAVSFDVKRGNIDRDPQ